MSKRDLTAVHYNAMSEDKSKPTKAELAAATKAVAKLMDNETTIDFASREEEPLSDGEPLIIDTYTDKNGNEYWIDPTTATVIQMGPHSGRYSPKEEGDKQVSELRQLAETIASRQIKNFTAVKSTLHPLEANDRLAVYFFRWEDLSEPLSETALPPFVQVGLHADGTLASFADTLSSSIS